MKLNWHFLHHLSSPVMFLGWICHHHNRHYKNIARVANICAGLFRSGSLLFSKNENDNAISITVGHAESTTPTPRAKGPAAHPKIGHLSSLWCCVISGYNNMDSGQPDFYEKCTQYSIKTSRKAYNMRCQLACNSRCHLFLWEMWFWKETKPPISIHLYVCNGWNNSQQTKNQHYRSTTSLQLQVTW